MNTSARGIALIQQFESLKLEAYRCPAGVWTIGWGSTRIDGKPVKAGMTITADEADAALLVDVAKFEVQVNKLVKVPLSQGEYDALVSFQYNTGALANSTLLRRLNEGDRTGAADQFLRWDKATVNGKKVVLRGLQRRRRAERDLFLGRATP